MGKKIVLAYSGGLDTSVIIKWLTKKGYGVIAYMADVGQEKTTRAAIERAKKLFGAEHANVQAHSGTQANMAVYFACLNFKDTILAMDLKSGGHLTHGSPFNRSGRQYKVIPYTVDLKTGQFDYESLEKIALEHKPKIIIAGASAYPWNIDWARFKAIAEKVPVQITGLSRTGAILMADISHPAGLVVAGLFNNPVGVADVTTFTTHKTMCGPRGAATAARASPRRSPTPRRPRPTRSTRGRSWRSPSPGSRRA